MHAVTNTWARVVGKGAAPPPPPTLVPSPAFDSDAAKWARAVGAAAALEAATGVGTADRAGVLHPEESVDDWIT